VEGFSLDGESIINAEACQFLERLFEVRDSTSIVRAFVILDFKVFVFLDLRAVILQDI